MDRAPAEHGPTMKGPKLLQPRAGARGQRSHLSL